MIIGSTLENEEYENGDYSFVGVVGNSGQLKTALIGAPNKLSIHFSEQVSAVQADFGLIALNRVPTMPALANFDAPSSTNNFTATFTYESQLLHAQYLIRAKDTILGTATNAVLDGDWTNPGKLATTAATSKFPSGNGSAGGNFDLVFSILQGDMNLNNKVDFLDVSPFGAAINDSPGANASLARMADINGTGTLDFFDVEPFGDQLNDEIAPNQHELIILADSNKDFELDSNELMAFTNSPTDVNGDDVADQLDIDAITALYNFGINLDVVL